MTERTNETYLGDGLFARFDGYAFELRTERDGSDHYVVIEPLMLRSFIEFAVRMGFQQSPPMQNPAMRRETP